MAVFVGFKHSTALKSTNDVDYVAVENATIWCKEDLWEQLKQSLLDTLSERMHKPRRGRPAKGPASDVLDGDAAHVAALVFEAYADIAAHQDEPVQYAQVARKLQISSTTFWRWRQHNPWPPRQPGTP